MQTEWIDRLCKWECNQICLSIPIINLEYLHNIEEEFHTKKIYVPLLIRRYMVSASQYYNTFFEDYNKEFETTRRYSLMEQNKEYIDWLSNHSEYNDLLLENHYKKYDETINNTITVYEDFKKSWIRK